MSKTTLLQLSSLEVHSVKKTIDDGMFGCGVFIDLQKAFDTNQWSTKVKKTTDDGVWLWCTY